MSRKRKAEQQRAHAEELRTQAATRAPDLQQSSLQAREAEAQAQLKKAEAERAEVEAERARQGHTVEQARHEDVLREADRVDPDVNHRSDDYTPTTPVDGHPGRRARDDRDDRDKRVPSRRPPAAPAPGHHHRGWRRRGHRGHPRQPPRRRSRHHPRLRGARLRCRPRAGRRLLVHHGMQTSRRFPRSTDRGKRRLSCIPW